MFIFYFTGFSFSVQSCARTKRFHSYDELTLNIKMRIQETVKKL